MAAEEYNFPQYLNPGRVKVDDTGRGGLKLYLQPQRPSVLDPCIFWENHDFVVIYDAYAKAEVHLLIMSKREYIKRVNDLNPLKSDHLKILREMINLAGIITSHFETLGIEIWQGFHAIPSLSPLHLHIISTDFNAPALKKNIHWNSFVTAFFVDPESVYAALESGQIANIHQKYYKSLKNRSPLTCPRCARRFKLVHQMKAHWSTCDAEMRPIDRSLILRRVD